MTARRAALFAALALSCTAAACGQDDDGGRSPAGGAATRLTVTVHPRGPDEPRRRETTADCSGPARDEATCRRLQMLPPDAFAPVPRGRVCTQIYGGPATATVRGELRGQPVSARFSLENGCRIDRWKRLAWLLGDPPGITRP